MPARLLLAFCLLISSFTARAQFGETPQNGLLAAIAALPAYYRDGIIKVSADNAHPDPENWYILARNANQAGDLYSLTISDGIIQAEKPSLDLRALLGRHTPIDIAKMTIDSSDAWEIAAKYCQDKDRELANVSYVLEQTGNSAVPIWSIWCYGKNNSYIGELRVLATNGAILSSE